METPEVRYARTVDGVPSPGTAAPRMDTAGDGFFATFDGPARAVRW